MSNAGRKAQAVVEVRAGRAAKSKAVKVDDGTLIRLRVLTLNAQIAEHRTDIDESEIVRRLVAAASA